MHAVVGKGATAFLQRAIIATRLAACTQGGAKIHHHLGVVTQSRVWRQLLRVLPELLFNSAFAGVAINRVKTRQYTFHVAIENRCAQVHAEAGNGAGGGAADAGQAGERIDVGGKFAGKFLHHLLRGLVQVARARVIAEAGPVMQHVIHRRTRQRLHVRKTLHEAFEVRNHGADLGLLQHDFRYPDAVRRDLLLPGQVLAAVPVVPAEHGALELSGRHLNSFFRPSSSCLFASSLAFCLAASLTTSSAVSPSPSIPNFSAMRSLAARAATSLPIALKPSLS